MDKITGTGNWIEILSLILIVLSFYFSLSFFYYLKLGDERAIKQTKLAAVICLALSLFIPAIVNGYK
ncbi:hypothetical protein [Metabacillus litoralis]|uniref:hypothetical protein n=1 Tax=Metabacillus TaxID=2675233 RepID=UPI000EF61089|nr:hypothetical protein [Metabacillus litoralis]MCM3163521.1 hypothetical protein [Metabacillus litoralis]